VKSRQIVGVQRRGKFILLGLTGHKTLLVHLRMTGGFAYIGPNHQHPTTTRLTLYFCDGHRLAYTDRRNLGVLRLVETSGSGLLRQTKPLGIEPLHEEFTVGKLGDLLHHSRRSIKEFLLDQTKVVGLGNIYVAEVLHRAEIDPKRRANEIGRNRDQVRALHGGIIVTLREAIETQSATAPLHFDLIGVDHPNSRSIRIERFRVYDREGEPCLTCGIAIRRIKQGGRSTYYCPHCQV
jgi:formamidopyrimidine-DNA glycosylase